MAAALVVGGTVGAKDRAEPLSSVDHRFQGHARVSTESVNFLPWPRKWIVVLRDRLQWFHSKHSAYLEGEWTWAELQSCRAVQSTPLGQPSAKLIAFAPPSRILEIQCESVAERDQLLGEIVLAVSEQQVARERKERAKASDPPISAWLCSLCPCSC